MRRVNPHFATYELLGVNHGCMLPQSEAQTGISNLNIIEQQLGRVRRVSELYLTTVNILATRRHCAHAAILTHR